MARKPYQNKIICGDWEDVIDSLPAGIAHTCATSPPYWGQRNYGVEGQLGLEKTPEEHIENLVRGFHKFKRILRNDGTLWVNYGDKYNSPGTKCSRHWDGRNKNINSQEYLSLQKNIGNLKEGNLICLPWRVAMALQADGWYLRSVIIWCKAWSFHDCGYETKVIKSEGLFGQELTDVIEDGQNYAGSTMPESVNGWRWERHKVKVKKGKVSRRGDPIETGERRAEYDKPDYLAKWKLCPGCAKCNKHDGWVLRKGSWRPTSAYEYLFMFSKTKSYYADAEAVRENYAESSLRRYALAQSRTSEKFSDGRDFAGGSPVANENLPRRYKSGQGRISSRGQNPDHLVVGGNDSGRNLRNIWVIGTKGYKGAHYATFPEKLIEPIIKASTSQKGVCPKCGSPWARMIETDYIQAGGKGKEKYDTNNKSGGLETGACRPQSMKHGRANRKDTTLGWMPTCECSIQDTVPALVYDPFMGSGTVAAVADKLGRHYCGSELNEDYIKEQAAPRLERLWRA